MGHAVVLLHHNRVERFVLECDGLALASMEDDGLRGRLFHLEAGSRFHFCNGKLARIEPLSLLMELDFAVGVCQNFSVVDGGGRVRRLAVAGIGHMKTRPLHGSAGYAVLLIDSQFRSLVVLKYQPLFIPGVQADRLLPVRVLVRQIVGGRNGLFDHLITAGGHPQGHRTVLAGGHIVSIVAVNTFNSKGGAGDGGGGVGGVHLGDGQKRLFQVIKNQFPFLAGAEVDGLDGFIPHHIRFGNGFLRQLIAVHRDMREGGPAILSGGHIGMVAGMDALDFKDRTGNDLFGLLIPLENGKAGQLLVCRLHGDGAASIHSGLIHMDNDRISQAGERRRGRNLHKGVHPLGHIRDGDGAVRLGGLGADDLAVPDDVEYCTGEGIAAVVVLDQFDLYPGVVLKHQGHIILSVPVKLLLDLIRVRAEGVPLRGRDLRRGKAADGQGVPGHILQIAPRPGGISAHKAVVGAFNLDDCSGQTLGRIIRIHLTDAAFAGDLRAVQEGDGHGIAAAIGQSHILRPRVVDLIALRSFQFNNGICGGVQTGQGVGPIAPGHDLLLVGPVFRAHDEPRSGQTLVGVGGVHLFHGQIVFLADNIQLPDHNGLHILGLMGAGAGAGIGVLMDGTIAPYALIAQVQNILGTVAEGHPIQQIIYTAVIAVVQVIINADQLLGAGGGRVRQQASLIAPDDSLHPSIHSPGIIAAPHLVYAQGMSLVGKHAGGMGIVVGHHGLHGRVGDGLGVAPGLALQGPAHAFPVLGTEADSAFLVVIEGHLMEPAGPQAGRFIVDAIVGAVLQLDRAGGVRRQRRGGQQAQHTHQHEQQGRHTGEKTVFLHQ